MIAQQRTYLRPAGLGPLWLGCLIGLVACDKQAPADYHGEPLLSVHGRVELALERDDEDSLIPALAFRNFEQGELRIVEAEVHGEFPAEFSLDVFLPPPDESFISPSEYLDEPELAIGFITAVTQDHPETIRFSAESSGTASGAVGGDNTTMSSWCTADESECYTETISCPAPDSAPEDCDVTGVGNPELKQDPWQHFAGLSQNYAVVYLSEAVPADSYTSYLLGKAGALPVGYQLVKLEADPRADDEGQCIGQADELAAQRYIEQNGSDYSVQELAYDDCGGTGCDDDVNAAVGRLRHLARAELNCPNDILVSPVQHPERESISVRIGDNLSPFGG